MKRNDLSIHDLEEDMRSKGQIDSVDKIKVAYAERDGHISIVPKGKQFSPNTETAPHSSP